jgi:hypothetical protein
MDRDTALRAGGGVVFSVTENTHLGIGMHKCINILTIMSMIEYRRCRYKSERGEIELR